MPFIPTKVHGLLDYLSGVLFIISPWLFDFADGGAAQWVPVIFGALAIVYSIFTDYERGFIKVIPMPAHLAMDVMSGVVMAASPWLFGFADVVYLPHVIFGIIEIGAGLMTQRRPYLDSLGQHLPDAKTN